MSPGHTTLDLIALGEISADDARLDYLINVEGIDQLRASQMLWAPELLDRAPGLDAAPSVRRAWIVATVARLIAEKLGHVQTWLGVTA